jgi:hypothetical protein
MYNLSVKNAHKILGKLTPGNIVLRNIGLSLISVLGLRQHINY